MLWPNQASFYKIEHKVQFIQIRPTSIVMGHERILELK